MLPTMVFAAEESTADAPEKPAMTTIPMTYIVNCKDGHDAAMMNLIFDTFKIGDVKKAGDEYVCPVTIYTDAYAKEYSAKNGKHFAVKESVTYNMTWDGEKWNAPKYSELPTIEVACARYHCWFPFGK